MYPKNATTPRAIYAKVVNASTGAPITSGVVAFHIQASTRGAVAGTAAAHIANGIWVYTPTTAETNYDAFAIEFYHADAVGDGPVVQVVTDSAWTTALTESYATDGATATPAELLYMIYSVVAQCDLDGTDLDTYELDGSTVAMSYEITLNSQGYTSRRVRTS